MFLSRPKLQAATGSVLDPHSATTDQLHGWLQYDRWLLLLGLTAIPVALLVRRLRPVALVLVIQWLVMVRGGYVPFMHVINLLPWSALLVPAPSAPSPERRLSGDRLAAVTNIERRRSRRTDRCRRAAGTRPRRRRDRVLGAVPAAGDERQPGTAAAVGHHLDADNVARNNVIVVHDSIWTDLVHRYGFNPRPVMIYKLDSGPAVRDNLTRIDYLVLPDWYYSNSEAPQKYPTLTNARKHAVEVASFGTGGRTDADAGPGSRHVVPAKALGGRR